MPYARCDVGAASEIEHAAASFGKGGPVTGVLHASGVLCDAVMRQQSAAHVRDVYAPKATGGRLILQASVEISGWISAARVS
jgi:hypothetical protein